MKKDEFRFWLSSSRGYGDRTIGSRLSNCRTVERHEGDLDQHFEQDQLRTLIRLLTYTSADQVENSPARHKIPIDGNVYNGTATLKSAVSLYKQFREKGVTATPRRRAQAPAPNAYHAAEVKQPGALPRTSEVLVSTEQLADWRRQLVRMLSVLEKDAPPQDRPGVGKRIGLLQRSGHIPSEIGAMMRTVTEMRNAVEYQNKTLSAAEGSAVRAAWFVIQEWADGCGIDVRR
jgi:hypothetical protein